MEQATQRRMERIKTARLPLRGKVPNGVVRQRTGLRDAFETISTMKQKWADYDARRTMIDGQRNHYNDVQGCTKKTRKTVYEVDQQHQNSSRKLIRYSPTTGKDGMH